MNVEPSRPVSSLVAVLPILFGWGVAAAEDEALAAHVPPGTRIDNVELATANGSRAKLLGDARANVFVFFKPGQEHSRTTLVEMAKCETEMADKSVHWVAVASARFAKEELLAAAKEAGLKMPVLLDQGDELYGRLKLALTPMIGIVDAKQVLVAFEPFTKINYCAVIRARILYLLGELSDAELDRVLHPPAATMGGDAALAQRNLKMAELFFKRNDLVKAYDSVNKSLEKDATVAAAHSLLGAILAAQGDCKKANDAFVKALSLDKADGLALAGSKSCAGK